MHTIINTMYEDYGQSACNMYRKFVYKFSLTVHICTYVRLIHQLTLLKLVLLTCYDH